MQRECDALMTLCKRRRLGRQVSTEAGFPSPIFCRQSSLARPVRRVQQAASSFEQRAWNMDFLGMMDGFVSIGLGKQVMEVAARTHGCQTRGIEAESPAANLIACTCLGSTDPSSQSPAVPSPTSQSKQTVCNPRSQTTDWPPDRKSRTPTPQEPTSTTTTTERS